MSITPIAIRYTLLNNIGGRAHALRTCEGVNLLQACGSVNLLEQPPIE